MGTGLGRPHRARTLAFLAILVAPAVVAGAGFGREVDRWCGLVLVQLIAGLLLLRAQVRPHLPARLAPEEVPHTFVVQGAYDVPAFVSLTGLLLGMSVLTIASVTLFFSHIDGPESFAPTAGWALALGVALCVHHRCSLVPVCWGFELAVVPVLLARAASSPLAWSGALVAAALAVALGILEGRRRGRGRVVVHTAARALACRVRFLGSPDWETERPAGPMDPPPAAGGPHIVLTVPAITLRATASFAVASAVFVWVNVTGFDRLAAMSWNVLAFTPGWAVGQERPLELGAQLMLASHPGDPVATYMLGDIRCAQGRHAEALALVDRARARGATDVVLRRLDGLASRVRSHQALERSALVAWRTAGQEVRARFPDQAAFVALELAQALRRPSRKTQSVSPAWPSAEVEALRHARVAARRLPRHRPAQLLAAELLTSRARSLDALERQSPGQLPANERPVDSLLSEARDALDRAAGCDPAGGAGHDPQIVVAWYLAELVRPDPMRLAELARRHGTAWVKTFHPMAAGVVEAYRKAGLISEASALARVLQETLTGAAPPAPPRAATAR